MPLSLQTTRFTRVSVNTSAAEPDYAIRGEADLSEAHTYLRDSALTSASPDGLIAEGEIAFLDNSSGNTSALSLFIRSGNTIHVFNSSSAVSLPV